MTFSTCAYCGGLCTAKSDPNSHGICEHCLALACPGAESSKRHTEAMKRGKAAFERGRTDHMKRLEQFADGVEAKDHKEEK